MKELFEEFILESKSQTNEVEETLAALLELSDRQWHTYELLDNVIKNEVENWIISKCKKESFNAIDLITLIIGRLGLVKAYEHVKSLLDDLANEIRATIQETVAELDGHVEDPWMK
ncbi:hypothetical protein [Paenibacillus sp. FJAT-27812]|uniref:hypothetical protein n=1 Tax=Paenibacillus sp. FJAT-27812 TaxID=1684143 RepID=UPI0006A78A07|nr:hypothetical protein [Paenibacillus sp. FJAT-27812]